jgi:hypothetical protein
MKDVIYTLEAMTEIINSKIIVKPVREDGLALSGNGSKEI